MSEQATEPRDPDIGDDDADDPSGSLPDAAVDPQQSPEADLSGDPIGAEL